MYNNTKSNVLDEGVGLSVKIVQGGEEIEREGRFTCPRYMVEDAAEIAAELLRRYLWKRDALELLEEVENQ